MVLDRDRDATKQGVKLGVALVGIGGGDDGRGGGIFRLDAVDLLGVENDIALQERDAAPHLFACIVFLGLFDPVGIDDD